MPCTPEELALKQRYEAVYERSQAPVMLSIERSVCGCDYGGNSWTTRAEADDLITMLDLRPGSHLLDLGAGSGWPALYVAKMSGCAVTLVDLPLNGLRIAEARAVKDGISQRVSAVIADAADLPLADSSFDAVSHSDLLCCLKQKRSVLQSCRRVLRSGGRMAFTVISIAPGLMPEQRRRAIESGPQFIESDDDYHIMLDQAGWKITSCEDFTVAHAASIRRQLEADGRQANELISLVGERAFAERVARWRVKLEAVDDGLTRRTLFLARPQPS